MGYWISVLFRAIPLALAAICVGFGLVVWETGEGPPAFVAGRVVVFLAAICICLFCTAATIIRQVIGRFSRADAVVYPLVAVACTLGTLGFGVSLMADAVKPAEFVAGHVIFGLGLICGCITMVVVASREFHRIASPPPAGSPPPFGAAARAALVGVPPLLALIGWGWAIGLLVTEDVQSHFIAGHVMFGLAAITTCLITLVLSILRQEEGTYGETERRAYPAVAAGLGVAAMLFGIVLLLIAEAPFWLAPGWVLIGLGLICLSIFGKVVLLALVWHRTCSFANRIPIIPIVTCLACLFLSSFLFNAALKDDALLIPAHVLVGLGAICFGLFAIVSILESGTSGSDDDAAAPAAPPAETPAVSPTSP